MGKGKTETKLNAIRATLKALENEGRLIPEEVIAAAADPSSPLHDEFVWDDTIAAARYRLMQAEQLIRRVKIVITHERVPLRIPLYISDQGTNGPAMISLTAGDFARADAENNINAELSRLRGNITRSFGVAVALDRKYPGLLQDFEDGFNDILAEFKRRRSRTPARLGETDEASVVTR